MHWLHTYAPTTPLARTRATWAALAALADWWTAQGHTLTVVRCATPTTYERAVRHWWGRTDLLLTEHDVVPTVQALADLLTCPEPVCAVAYPLYADPVTLPVLQAALAAAATSPAVQQPAVAQRLADVASYVAGMTPTGWAWSPRCDEPAGHWRFCRDREPWADAAGLGLTRWRRAAQQASPPTLWGAGTWRDLDTRLHRAWHAGGGRVHVHWPAVAHHHGPEATPHDH
jgi:hypothetical protein